MKASVGISIRDQWCVTDVCFFFHGSVVSCHVAAAEVTENLVH